MDLGFGISPYGFGNPTLYHRADYSEVAELRQRNAQYQAKYGMDYLTFNQRVSEDEVFIENRELKINNLWEIDLADWEFCYNGIGDWTCKLQNILLETNKLLDA